MSNTFVCLMGMGTVFAGLICIVFICFVMSLIVRSFAKTSKKTMPEAAVQSKELPIENKQEIIAGTCAVIAEELGTDVSNIRVLSFKRV